MKKRRQFSWQLNFILVHELPTTYYYRRRQSGQLFPRFNDSRGDIDSDSLLRKKTQQKNK